MIQLYKDIERLVHCINALIDAAMFYGLFGSWPDGDQYKIKRLNPLDAWKTMNGIVAMVRTHCERSQMITMAHLFEKAKWTPELFEYLEIDPVTGENIHPANDTAFIKHKLRSTHGRRLFGTMDKNWRTQEICDVYVYQSPGYVFNICSNKSDVSSIPSDMLNDDIIVYTAQMCKPEDLAQISPMRFTPELMERLMAEAPADILSQLPQTQLTDDMLITFLENHDADCMKLSVIEDRKTKLLDTLSKKQTPNHQLMRSICDSIADLDTLPKNLQIQLLAVSPFLIQLFAVKSSLFAPNEHGEYSDHQVKAALAALTSNTLVPSPYQYDKTLYSGSKVATKLLPEPLVKVCCPKPARKPAGKVIAM